VDLGAHICRSGWLDIRRETEHYALPMRSTRLGFFCVLLAVGLPVACSDSEPSTRDTTSLSAAVTSSTSPATVPADTTVGDGGLIKSCVSIWADLQAVGPTGSVDIPDFESMKDACLGALDITEGPPGNVDQECSEVAPFVRGVIDAIAVEVFSFQEWTDEVYVIPADRQDVFLQIPEDESELPVELTGLLTPSDIAFAKSLIANCDQ